MGHTFNLSRRHIGFPLRISTFVQKTTKGLVIAYLLINDYNQFVEKGLFYSMLTFVRGVK